MVPDERRGAHLTGRLAVVIVAAIAISLSAGAAFGRATAAAPIVVPDELQRADLAQPFADFFQAYHVVTTESFYAPGIDRKRLIYAAINGMLSGGTGDAHTIYLSPQENATVQNGLNGSFDGIGVDAEWTPHGITIIPLVGSPATRAGLRTGDLIVRIDGRDVTAMTETEAVNLLRGAAGTRVSLGVRRAGVHGAFTVVVTRAHIDVPNVVSRMIGRIAYLHISQFGTTVDSETRNALRTLMARHPSGLVLDLRNNPGGFVDAAVAVNSEFLPRGRIILWEENNRHQLEAPLRSTGGGLALTVPMAVLVNDGSASAAEITAGALQDDRRATIVGITTYGKGSVQQDYPLADGSSLRITTHLWLTPKKHLIQNRGITPDAIVDSPLSDGSPQDKQLARALLILQAGRS